MGGTHRLVPVVLAVLLASIMLAAPAGAATQPNYQPTDVGPDLRANPPSLDLSTLPAAPGEEQAGAGASATAAPVVDDVKIWLILNDYLGRYQATNFTLYAVSEKTEIWVQNNLAWPAGDPRTTPVVTKEQATYMLGQFDANIMPEVSSFFGTPDSHDGSSAFLPSLLGLPSDYYYSETGKHVILVSNIRDENYYDPSYPTYIAGFYSPSFEVYFDRNVISIDAYDWANRTGPSGTRPYLYEGVFAHEFQHLIHDDLDPDEETFVNEGCADFAELVCGYAAGLAGHIDAARALPENSLTVWGDQGPLEILSDYGHAYLWTLYLSEQLGQSFIQRMVANPGNGISGINATLQEVGSSRTFASLFHDWTIALTIDSWTPGGGRYAFTSLDFTHDLGTPTAPNPEAFDTVGAGPWGSDYLWVGANQSNLQKLVFEGLDYAMFPTEWTSDGSVLWSGGGDLIDRWAIFEATGGGTLTFDTRYDIEDYWDFGFVQVSTDGGYTWTSLANAYTTYDHDPNAHPSIIANLPGLTSFTTAWVTMSFDLSAYAGQDILIAFRYMTDWATSYTGWFIDNVYVDGTLVSDGSSTGPFKSLTEYFPVDMDFTVQFVGIKTDPKKRSNAYKVLTMKVGDITSGGFKELNSLLKDSTKVLMVVTSDAPEGFSDYIPYRYDIGFQTPPKK